MRLSKVSISGLLASKPRLRFARHIQTRITLPIVQLFNSDNILAILRSKPKTGFMRPSNPTPQVLEYYVANGFLK
jgi:hypothetical protein